MIFDRNEKKEVIALLGAGSMGTAIVRRIAAGRKILLGDISDKNLEKTAHDLTYSGYDVETMIVDALDKTPLMLLRGRLHRSVMSCILLILREHLRIRPSRNISLPWIWSEQDMPWMPLVR